MKRTADAAFVVEHLPGPSTASSSCPSPSPADEFPPRKRSRSEVTPEERKEARAHRNRIAAQNSRDRRKAQFSLLERRVADLEEENRQLRAGMGISSSQTSEEDRQRELAREKENRELKERIKTLENGWDAVIKALAASGLPFTVPTPPPSESTAPSRPVFVPSTEHYPSPAPSTPSSSSSFELEDFEPTRHLAAGGLATNQLELELTPSRPTTTPTPNEPAPTSPIDEGAMEDLFREILAPSPILTSLALPVGAPHESSPTLQTAPSGAPGAINLSEPLLDWEGDAEMQRLLDVLAHVQPDVNALDGADTAEFPSALDLGLDGWDMNHSMSNSTLPTAVGAF